MRKIFIFLCSALLLWGCSKESTVELVKSTDSGCANDLTTRAADSELADPQLILEYSEQGLVITRTNALLNCSIKNGGIVQEVSTEGNVIRYNAYERDGKTLRCNCIVETMTATIAGLNPGSEYVLEYTCDGSYAPISFTYKKGLRLVVDLNLYLL
jgi:hypothetical protein